MSTEALYECCYLFGGRVLIAHGHSVYEFIDGFWIDEDLSYDRSLKSMEQAYWIMPHMIRRIEQLNYARKE